MAGAYSRHHMNGHDPDGRARPSAVVNRDKIACRNTGEATALLEETAVAQALTDAPARIAGAPDAWVLQISLEFLSSNYVPFLDLGPPAVPTIEGADPANDRARTERDAPPHSVLHWNPAEERHFRCEGSGWDTRPAQPTM